MYLSSSSPPGDCIPSLQLGMNPTHNVVAFKNPSCNLRDVVFKLTVHRARNVTVPKLMAVEEYETVFQLVSVVEGDLTGSGIAVLAASLPPGSMTGAPKKRSCDLLSIIEGEKARGVYSGVIGYLDVGGGGDFSVVIRSAFK